MRFEWLSRRGRAALLIVLAVAVIIAASVAYLRPISAPEPKQAAPSVNPSLVTADYVAYQFISPSVGWALDFVQGPSSTPGHFIVFKTVDGAKHWVPQLTGQGQFCGFGPRAVQFLDPMHGFIRVRCPTAQLYRTTDGGAHWDTVVLPGSRVDVIAFSDPAYGWLLTSDAVRKLYATRDAGNNWQPLPAPPLDAYALSFGGPSRALMAGYGLGPPHVYTSNDGGQSWQRHELPPPAGSWGSGSYFPPQVQILPGAVAVASIESEGQSATFHFTSFDDGVSWTHVQPPPGLVAYQDAFHWWASRDTALFKSSDGGKTWSQVTSRLPGSGVVLSVLDSKHAWASLAVFGGYGLAFSEDGGFRWTRATVPKVG
jgi:photosystem II stability/assembly factor-like uncharacterized protein